MLFHQSWWRCSILDSSVHPQMDRVHTPPSKGTHSTSSPLWTYNLGWFHMIYSWFLLLSSSLHQFIGAGKGGIPAVAKQPGRCSFFPFVFIFLIRALENSKGLFFYNVQGADVGRDWKLLLLFIQMDQFCACEQQQVQWNSSISFQWWYKEKLSPVLIERWEQSIEDFKNHW